MNKEYANKYYNYFKSNGMADSIIPLIKGTKRPVFSHKPLSSCNEDELEKRRKTYERFGLKFGEYDSVVEDILKNDSIWEESDVGILLNDMLVIDYDNSEHFQDINGVDIENISTPIQKTKKGYHIFFKKDEDIYDGAIKSLNIDIKTCCKTGTRSILKVFPCSDRIWINDLITTELMPLPEKTKLHLCELLNINNSKKHVDYNNELLNCIDPHERSTWLKVGIICKGLGLDMNTWNEWASKSPKFDLDDSIKTWHSINRFELGIGTLKMLAKQDNPKRYYELYHVQKNLRTYEIEENSPYELAKYMVQLCDEQFVCFCPDKKRFYYFNYSLHKWHEDIGKRQLYKFINEDLCINLKHSPKLVKQLRGSYKQAIIDEFSKMVYDEYFFDKLDKNKAFVGFTNGIFDLQTKSLKQGYPNDFVSKCVGYEYNTYIDDTILDEVSTFFRQVYPIQEERNYALQQYAQCIGGYLNNSIVHLHSGEGSNGKSMIALLMQEVLGDYACKMDSKMLCIGNKDASAPDPTKLMLRSMRYCYLSEPPAGSQLNSSLVKDITGGECLQARALFSNTIVSFYPQLKLHIFVNDGQGFQFDGSDGGLQRRLRVMNYKSIFADSGINESLNIFKKDEYLSSKFSKWKHTFMQLLLNKYIHEYQYKCPEIILQDSKHFISSQDDVLNFINDNLVITNDKNDTASYKELRDAYKCQYGLLKSKQLKEQIIKKTKVTCIANVFFGLYLKT